MQPFIIVISGRQVINNWRVTHSLGNVTYLSAVGCIQIDIPGIYLVYSQLLFKEGGGLFISHQTFINKKRVLERSIALPYEPSENNKGLRSSYQSAAFPLKRHDRVCIGSGSPRVIVRPEGTYFGVALLSRT